MIVTTSRRHEDELKAHAIFYSEKLNKPFVKRFDRSIQALISEYGQDVFVVGHEKLSLHSKGGGSPFYYHPNSAMLRGKHFLKTQKDPLIDVSQLTSGMTFLDCTLGLAADSLVAKLAVGEEGRVIGIEADAGIAAIVESGLKNWNDGDQMIIKAMRTIQVVLANHVDYLRTLPDRSVDVVYFDPMFEQQLVKSVGINSLKLFASKEDLSADAIEEARRVAKSRVVLKDHWESKRFDRFEFTVIKRKNTIFHYGFIDLKNPCLND